MKLNELTATFGPDGPYQISFDSMEMRTADRSIVASFQIVK
jgi:hypothetical protein